MTEGAPRLIGEGARHAEQPAGDVVEGADLAAEVGDAQRVGDLGERDNPPAGLAIRLGSRPHGGPARVGGGVFRVGDERGEIGLQRRDGQTGAAGTIRRARPFLHQ